MKRTLLAICFLACASLAYAAAGDPGTGVVDSPHDMTKWGGVDAYGRVCAFCHTPHHAIQGPAASDYYPLWSRDIDGNPFAAYASTTIDAANWAADIAIGPTRLCMSCHDGLIAVDQHYGSANAGYFTTEAIAGVAAGSTWLGGAAVGAGAKTLTNDHPVGFVYNDVAVGPVAGDPDAATIAAAVAAGGQDPWIRQADGTLFYTGNASLAVNTRLYADPVSGQQYMTCATCHDVHNKKNKDLVGATANYLVLAPQADSALCLTCHIK